MDREEIAKALQSMGWQAGDRGVYRGGKADLGFRHPKERQLGLLYVNDGFITATGPYATLERLVPSTKRGVRGDPVWTGQAVQALLAAVEGRYAKLP